MVYRPRVQQVIPGAWRRGNWPAIRGEMSKRVNWDALALRRVHRRIGGSGLKFQRRSQVSAKKGIPRWR